MIRRFLFLGAGALALMLASISTVLNSPTFTASSLTLRSSGVMRMTGPFDLTAVPHLSKPQVLELARGEWIEQRANVCQLGSPGTGQTHLATALGLAACRQGKRVRFFTAAA